MNSKISFLVITTLSFTVLSCSPKPTQLVINAFADQFPEANDVSWKLEYDGMWEVSFYLEKF